MDVPADQNMLNLEQIQTQHQLFPIFSSDISYVNKCVVILDRPKDVWNMRYDCESNYCVTDNKSFVMKMKISKINENTKTYLCFVHYINIPHTND